MIAVDPDDFVSAKDQDNVKPGTFGDADMATQDDVVDESLQEDNDESMRRRWKESPFAVGLTQPAWADEPAGCAGLFRACCSNSRYSYVLFSGVICRNAGRVGNMVVLARRMEEIEDASGQRIRRPRIMCVVGPYWMVLFFLTIPFFGGLSAWTALSRLPDHNFAVVLTWTICQVGLFVSLVNVACRDPGIMYRHAAPPQGQEESWRWNDQALTYRPANAKFDPECQVVVEGFDHTCPWTGTAIGKNNMPWFRRFLFFTLSVLVYDIVLLALS
jgi:hypothetical protein